VAEHDERAVTWMRRAISLGESVRQRTPPNPWVGAVLISREGELFEGATEPPGGKHAEIVALEAAGARARGGTLVVSLEPCSHQGRTAPCVEAIADAGVERVIVGIQDPDPQVDGAGIRRLREAGIAVELGVASEQVVESLGAYLHHRRTGRPRVVVKLAATLDGRTAAADGSSKWITGEAARRDVAELRAACDAIIVGAGTVRRDDPELTARTEPPPLRQPLRVVLGKIPEGARILPAESMSGPLEEILARLGERGLLQVLVEGGASVAYDFVQAGLVDRFVLYFAPVFMGGDDGAPMLRGPGAASIDEVLRGRFVSVLQIGDDLRVEVEAECR
jgi:diaminohydroxyphosphoribosylaminopyrimidine deaminase/5-amino-6-(5-phosphoribosylamino)uracil reductase